MRCEPCQGSGIAGGPVLRWMKPCEACGGSGIAHCCDGLVAVSTTDEKIEDQATVVSTTESSD